MKIERLIPALEAIDREYWHDMTLIRSGWRLLDQCETPDGLELTYDTGGGIYLEKLNHDGSKQLTRITVIQP